MAEQPRYKDIYEFVRYYFTFEWHHTKSTIDKSLLAPDVQHIWFRKGAVIRDFGTLRAGMTFDALTLRFCSENSDMDFIDFFISDRLVTAEDGYYFMKRRENEIDYKNGIVRYFYGKITFSTMQNGLTMRRNEMKANDTIGNDECENDECEDDTTENDECEDDTTENEGPNKQLTDLRKKFRQLSGIVKSLTESDVYRDTIKNGKDDRIKDNEIKDRRIKELEDKVERLSNEVECLRWEIKGMTSLS